MREIKRGIYLSILVAFLILFTIFPASAGIRDWYRGITGRAISDTSSLNITVGNAAPTITSVTSIAATNPTEATTVNITFNFTASDSNGGSDLNNNGAQGRFQRTGEPTRTNTTCNNITGTFATNFRNYTCTMQMWYFDQNGAWTINATINDSAGSRAENSTTSFTYNTLKAMVMAPKALTWPGGITVTSTNQLSNNDPIVLNNTGNVNTTINTTAINLAGETNSTQFIFAGNFTINNADACEGTVMVNGTQTVISGANLPRGNNSLNYANETSGQEQLYFCLEALNSDLSSQSYSSTAGGAWTINVV